MRFVRDFLPLPLAALAGASLALFVGFPATEPPPEPTWITVDSEMAGIEFAIISDGIFDHGRPFRTPVTLSTHETELSFVVVPVSQDAGDITVRTVRETRSSSFRSQSISSAYTLHSLTPNGVRTRTIGEGQLEEMLASSGLPLTGLQFGDRSACVSPSAWNLAMDEKLLEARNLCRYQDR